MAEPTPHKSVRHPKPKARKFYSISYSTAHKLADFEVENLDALLGDSPIRVLGYPGGGVGFPEYREKPRVVIGINRSGPLPRDIELFHYYWLISEKLKRLFESVDPTAFAFQACDVFLRDGSVGPAYWLCDIVRILEPFAKTTKDELQSSQARTGNHVSFLIRKNLIFNETAIGESHIFRTPYSPGSVLCDQFLKDACKTAGIRGVSFNAK